MSKQFTEQEVKARREYYKKWREEHKEQVKQHRQNFWERKATELTNPSNVTNK